MQFTQAAGTPPVPPVAVLTDVVFSEGSRPQWGPCTEGQAPVLGVTITASRPRPLLELHCAQPLHSPGSRMWLPGLHTLSPKEQLQSTSSRASPGCLIPGTLCLSVPASHFCTQPAFIIRVPCSPTPPFPDMQEVKPGSAAYASSCLFLLSH